MSTRDSESFAPNVEALGALTGRDTARWDEYLAALWDRRQVFRSYGATATDHGHPTATTSDLDADKCQYLLNGAIEGRLDGKEADLFRGQVLTEMAAMSLEDGLVMPIHPASRRDHNPVVFPGASAGTGPRTYPVPPTMSKLSALCSAASATTGA